MTDHRVPTKDEVLSYLKDDRRWGRWGDKGSAGAINLINAEKRLEAVGLVSNGRTVSLSRPWAVEPRTENPRPAQHFMSVMDRPSGGGAAMDFYGVFYHGTATTHIDALCHVWDENGIWDGKSPDEILGFNGATYGFRRRLERRHPDARSAAGRSETPRELTTSHSMPQCTAGSWTTSPQRRESKSGPGTP